MSSASNPSPGLVPATPCEDAYLSSGPSPTQRSVHVIGAGKVGQALLRLLPARDYRLQCLSDSTASVFDRDGLDAASLAEFKRRGGRLRDRERSSTLDLEVLANVTPADAVVDVSSTTTESTRSAPWIAPLLARGTPLVLAAKDSVLAHLPEILRRPGRVAINAALGGTGRALLEEREELRAETVDVSCVPNASTTCVLQVVERGGSFAEGEAEARRRGLLEHDAALDLDGTDAALKLAIVAGVLGRPIDWRAIARPSLLDQDPAWLQGIYSDGLTTRLVGQITESAITLDYEEIPRASTLAVSAERVAYAYRLRDGRTRIHLGEGLGPERVALAVLEDLNALLVGRRAS